MKIPSIMLITSGNLHKEENGLKQVLNGCEKGLPGVQLREKNLDSQSLLEMAFLLREATNRHGTFFTVNSRIDIALAAGADGVHLSEKGIPLQVVKKIKPSFIIGVSVHYLEEALFAQKEGADYVIFGPVFETFSKKAYWPPQGLIKLERITKSLSIPVLAVGGITPERAKKCLEAGAYGIAAITAFLQNENMETVIQEFMPILE